MGMLILTRYKGQSINIGNDIIITILGGEKGQIRVGIEAPTDIPVHRNEIYEKIQKEKLVNEKD